MENRFGFKELVLSALLVGVIIVVVLAMFQYDRQWKKLGSIDSRLKEQTRELSHVRTLLANGQVLAPNPTSGSDHQANANGGQKGASGGQGGENVIHSPNVKPFYRITKTKQNNDDYALGDWLVQSFGVVPDRLTPLISSDAYAAAVQGYVLESLAHRDPETLEWTPFIARDWRITDNTKAWRAYVDKRKKAPLTEKEIRGEPTFPHRDVDKPSGNQEAEQKKYIQERMKEGRRTADIAREKDAPPAILIDFDLRPGVTFSDGKPVTVDDVVFTFNWIMNPKVQAPRQRAYYDKIKRVTKVDADTVRFAFNEPYFQALDLAGGMPILAKHFYGRYTPKQFNQSTGLLLGSGPYKLPDPTSWRPEPGKPIKLVRNERYWGEPAPFDQLVWRVIENDAARLTTFRNKDLDTFNAQPEQYVSLKDDPAVNDWTNRWEYLPPDAGYAYIGWNEKRNGKPTPFADANVRRAMTMLCDRHRIINEIRYGYGKIITGPFSPLTPQSDHSIAPWPYDPARAKKLLKQAGYEDRDGDGVLEGRDGKPFKFTLSYLASNKNTEKVVLFLKDTFARAGVLLVPDPIEWSVLISRLNNRDFAAVSLGWTGGVETDPYQIFDSSQIKGTGDNFISYSNPKTDHFIEKARSTIDKDKRMPLWHKVHHLLHQDQPYTFLYTGETLSFTSKRLHGLEKTRTGLNSPLEWFVPKPMRKWKQ